MDENVSADKSAGIRLPADENANKTAGEYKNVMTGLSVDVKEV